LGLNFVDPNNWIEEGDFARNGLYLNGKGKRRLEQLHARISGLHVGGSQGVRYDKIWEMEITERGIPRKRDDQRSKNRILYVKKMNL